MQDFIQEPLSVKGLRVELSSDTPNVDSTMVRVSGEIDVSNAGAFRDAIHLACEPSRPIVVDMAGVTFIDSSGVSVLIGVARATGEAHAGLVIQDPSPSVRRVLTILGLDEDFGIRREEDG